MPQVWGGWRAEWPWAEGCAPHPQPLPAGLLSPLQVVTAETLMEGQVTCLVLPGQGFRLEDVDWNSIAHRYPNLFTNLESNSDQK